MTTSQTIGLILTAALSPGLFILVWAGVLTVDRWISKEFGFNWGSEEGESRVHTAITLLSILAVFAVALLLTFRGLTAMN